MIRPFKLMTRPLKPLALTSLTLALAACGAFGPDRNPPAMPQPAHYAIASQPAAFDADGNAQTLKAGAAPVPQWWTAFNSPELNALVEEGLNNSPSLKSAQRTLQAARDGLQSQIGESLFPSVDVGFAPSRQKALGIPGLSEETFLYNIFQAQVQASYTFDFFGASVLADRALAEQVDQQAFQFAATRRALATNIVVATINVSALQEQLNYTTQMVALGEERADQMKERYELGSASHDEALTAEQDAANLAATLPTIRMQLMAARHAQAVLLGRAPDQAPAVLPITAYNLPHDVPVAIPSDLIHQRPDILAAEAAVRATADEAGAATASMFPSLTLSASYGRGGFDWTTFTSPAGLVWGIGARLTQPIFHGGALVARKHQYANLHEAAIADYQQTVLSAFQSVANSLVSLEEDANTLKQTLRAEDAAAGMSGDTQARYRLGATPYYATLTASQQMYQARIQSVRARAARLNDTAALFDAMGDPPVEMKPHGLFGIRMPEAYAASGVAVAK